MENKITDREIKFRVWDIGNERMVYDPYLFELQAHGYVFYEDWRDCEDGIQRTCVVMQFTGLKDKNGKEIYEGDIINRTYTNGSSFEDENVKMEVMWQDGSYIVWGSNMTDIFNTNAAMYMEVIGNIYENKELLKS